MSADGHITYTYNDETTVVDDTQIKYINSIDVDNGGTITYKNNANETVKTDTNKIRWVTGTVYNASAGTLTFNYNYGNSDVYEYKYIASVNLSDTGLFTVVDNTGATMLSKQLTWVADIDIYEDHFRITYNDGTTEILSEVLLNQISRMIVPDSGTYTYHLLVLYTAASQQGDITYDGVTGWIDLGTIKDYNGILVGTNISSTVDPRMSTIAGCLAYLNETYPSGITSGYAAGK